MKTQKMMGMLAAIMALALTSTGARATVLLYTNPQSPDPVSTTATGVTIGMQFVVGSTNIKVSALGVWDYQKNGLVGSRQVGLWEVATGDLLAQATVGVSDPLTIDGANGFRFAPTLFDGAITPVQIPSLTLTAGGTYRLGMLQSDGTAEPYLDVGGTLPGSTADFQGVTAGPAMYSGAGFQEPIGAASLGMGYFGPNLEFDYVVPEPSVVILMGIGAGLLWLRRWRNR